MEQKDIDRFISVMEDSSFVKSSADRKLRILKAFKSKDLSEAIYKATNSMKRFGGIASIR